MADNTNIEWADATVNAVNGCSVLSPGCTNCYAMRLAGTRLKHHASRAGLTQPTKAGPVWTGEVRLDEKQLLQPLRWRRPRKIFWNAHGDLFHENVSDEWIDRVFAVCRMAPEHTHMILTKRSGRMREYFDARRDGDPWAEAADWLADAIGLHEHPVVLEPNDLPLPNGWLGVSVEDQTRADERIPDLRATPAAVRFISAEPLLGPLNIIDELSRPCSNCDEERVLCLSLRSEKNGARCCVECQHDRGIDWVIVGGESGPGSRPMHPDWVRSLRDQCAAAGTAFFFKQWGDWVPLRDSGASGFWPTNADGCIRLSVDGSRSDDGWPMQRVGKGRAGNTLDGVQHLAFPATVTGAP